MTHDFYDLLGVPADASQDEIKEAFRKKVQEVHPDLNDDPRAPAQFTALKKGYDTLKDPVERKAYDRLGHKDYVAKRLEGLPDPDQWKPADADGDAGGGSGTTSGSASTGATTAGRSGGSTTSTTAGSAGKTASSGGSASADTSTSTGTGSGSSSRTNTRTRTSTGSATAGGTRTGTTSSGGTNAGASTSTSKAAAGTSDASSEASSTSTPTSDTTSGPGLVERLRSLNYGWPVVFLTSLVYLAGVGLYARGHVGALREFAAAVRAAGTDTTALREALVAGEYGLTSVFEYVRTTAVSDGLPGAGLLVALGAVALPAVFFVVVRTTRRSFAWQPTYLYVVAVLTPLFGLGAGAAEYDWPVVTVVAFGVLPLLAVVALPFNAFVTPRLKRLF
ncbi:J domain-containing protein [Halostella litorea]|uniref:J domain-containing protein n=1 Tax=Halostella litorea TaxID=2528831 RepID=UPI0010924982|nr:J domain-containing protein [Halostella litorea]